MNDMLVKNMESEYEQYLNDESRTVGKADYISFPKCEDDIVRIISYAKKNKMKITVQGALTGITAGAVPSGGIILNISKMNKIKGLRYDKTKKCFMLSVQPGVLLSEIRKALGDVDFDTEEWSEDSINALKLFQKSGKWFFTPDPTESSASIGGMAACNASGARSFHYGATRNYVNSARVVLTDGSRTTLTRGADKVKNLEFTLKTDSGREIKGKLPYYTMPDVKNASGYYVKKDMDLLDLFIGSEGTLGVITELELQLVPLPDQIWGVTSFFPSEKSAIDFVYAVREAELDVKIAAIEYFNSNALELIRKQKEVTMAFSQMQDIPVNYHTAIYIELHGGTTEKMAEAMLKVGDIIVKCGGNEKNTWLAANPVNLDRLIAFRHATPECVNLIISERKKKNPHITKLGTDMAVPDSQLNEIVDYYNDFISRSGLQAVMFGHIGNNHIHVNILPRNDDDYNKGKSMYLKWSDHVVRLGGTISAEHGVGKLKTSMLFEMYGKDNIEKMKQIKKIFDPDFILNSGNIF
ncbi:MAG: FAD-binding oxidoreductase [Clostridium luticellarii]|jgi:D-lactate dehydrogenase (cytochrome)|uniref:D-lactate dehydrogenase (cytochrome) n=2 Tax=Clostridium luticellarii TaxID=1691940 RepID=A0A2T0BMB9_9CLOT|nr:FAD-binding oxidoreductase [Clostridium luticellarii]MCI1945211.1 FAD-binding oxidoreductase [Clostridium luticellarii]MCI1995613.1 FAD-binding oxidoreductase [Clostridium luticellarii]MCI2040001.1 FAD-binding oxidoreductase [Clostridium luticellarii]PRR85020.1 putative FAD-linked oxidoreductase [Clostridium luticellarii]